MTQMNAGPGSPGGPASAPGSPSPLPTFSLKPSEERFTGPLTQDDKLMAALCYPLGLISLVIWLMKKDQSRFIDICGKEALNFMISFVICAVTLSVVTFPVAHVLPFLGCLTVPVFVLLWLFYIVMTIIGAVKAYNGIVFRLPLCLRLIK
jgi:hypothetical protein